MNNKEPMTRAEWRKQQKNKKQGVIEPTDKPIKKEEKQSFFARKKADLNLNRTKTKEKGNKVDSILNKIIIVLILLIIILCIFIFNV